MTVSFPPDRNMCLKAWVLLKRSKKIRIKTISVRRDARKMH